MFTRLAFIVMAALFVTLPTYAQDDSWEILFYDYAQINILTAEGVVDSIPVPAEAQGIFRFTGLNHMTLSPDRRYLVFVAGEFNGDGIAQGASVQVADLVNQTCCQLVQPPANMTPDAITIGPFNPDGTQFVVNFAAVYAPDDSQPVLVTVDLESLATTHTLNLMDTLNNQGAFMHDWTADGISLFPTCLACGGPVGGYFARWNPETGTLTPDAYYFNWLGDRLPTTGEMLIPIRDESRPVSDSDGMFPPNNVMTYLPTGDPDNAVEIYYNPAQLNLPHPYWVQNGAAYLLHNWAEPIATLVNRSGTSQMIDLPADLHFIAATPDGWLMQRHEAEVFQFQVSADGSVSYREIPNIGGPLVILEAPKLGGENLGPVQPILG